MTSIENLYPHQRRLVEEYRSGSAPRVVALDAPPGTGKSVALAVIAAGRAAEGGLVIVVTQPLLVRQWAHHLSDAGVSPSAVYASTADFRLTIDTAAVPWPDSGIIILSPSVVRAPVAAKQLLTVSPSLLIVDDVAVSASSELGRSLISLADRTAQIIFTGARPNAWFPPHETRRWTYPLANSLGQRLAPHLEVRVHNYEGDRAEAEAVRQASEILRQADYPLQNVLYSRPAYQSALLSLMRRLEISERLPLSEEDEAESEVERIWYPGLNRQQSDAVWNLLDRFDNLPSDRRLLATMEEIKSAHDQGRAVLIVTSLAREVDYVVAAIDSSEIPIIAVTGRTSLDQRLAAAEKLHEEGSTLIVTPLFFTAMQNPLPDGTRSIWFTPPRNQQELRHRLGTGISDNYLEVVLLRAIPSVTPADELVDSLTEVLRDPWREYES
jgi:hypothetical protein